MKLPNINNSINDLQILYITDDSAINISLQSHGELLNRLNSRSVLESHYLQAMPDVEGVLLDDEGVDLFGRNLRSMLKGGQLAPIIVP